MATVHAATGGIAQSVEEPGDNLLVLTGDRLHLFDAAGSYVADKTLFLTDQTAGNPYLPFGRQANAIVVGDLIDNGLTGSSGPFEEEVVVATQSGALLWLHANDLLTPGPNLGSAYYLANVGGANSQIQPRTNQCMSSTWAITQRAGDAGQLHLLDQRGGYWRVDGAGNVVMQDREEFAYGARGWDDLGNRDVNGNVIQPTAGQWPPARLTKTATLAGTLIQPNPWCPIDPLVVAYEKSGGPYYVHNNWRRFAAPLLSFQGFIVHQWGGCLLDDPANGREIWQWSAGLGSWGNLVQGVRFPQAGSATWPVTGLWASSAESTQSGTTADHLPYRDLRSSVTATPIMTHQAIQAFNLPNGSRAVVLGCPGGGVRIINLLPSDLGTPFQQLHSLGAPPIEIASGADLGYGGGAMAVQQAANGDLTIWFGTLYRPTARPAAYASPGQGALSDTEVATGELHRLTWSVGASAIAMNNSIALPPSSASRGGYGVAGLCVGNLITETTGPQIDELIVATLAGDVIVFSTATLQQVWRTHVPGASGLFNSIRIANLNSASGDALNELYVAGSFGVWRFTQSGEPVVP